MEKAIVLPISGPMRIEHKHSKKLEILLRNFITETDGSYYDDEAMLGIIKMYFKLDNGISVKIEIKIGDDDYKCTSTLSCHANAEDTDMIIRCILVANNINQEISDGHFTVDRTGEIHFVNYYKPDGDVSYEMLDRMIDTPLKQIKKYGEQFSGLSKE